MRVDGLIFADEVLVEQIRKDQGPEQVVNVATLPGIQKASLAMPDIHWGYGFPIGGVAAFDPDEGGIVSAGGVGFDISCGVRTLRTGVTVEQIEPLKRELAHQLSRSVPAGVGSHSLETPMACGVGICFSCVTPVKTLQGWDYKRVCVDGPCFDAAKLVWE